MKKQARWLVAVAALAVASGCVSARTKNVAPATPGSPSNEGKVIAPNGTVYGPQETYGPPVSEGYQVPFGPEPMKLMPIALVFGPGMARGYAYIGVIRAMNEMKIPIASINGMEMGALIGAIYASDPKINHFEWALLKFKDDLFLPEQGIMKLFEGGQDIDRLNGPLRQVFGRLDISKTKIPLRIAIQEKSAALPTLLEKGSLISALKVALAAPGYFSPGTWNFGPAQAATGEASAAFLCQDVKSRGGNPIVFVDAGEKPTQASAADFVIRVDLKGIADSDFMKRTDIIFYGKKATEDRGDDLRKLVGLGAGS